MRILLVEDEPNIAEGLVFNFRLARYQTDVAESGEAGLTMLERNDYALIVLDVMLPGINGFQFARKVREQDGRIPILMLTALSADEDRIAGLESGVDDYVTKPFVLKELLLRIAGLIRRAQWHVGPVPSREFSLGAALVDPDRLVAHTTAGDHSLTRIEADLLQYFARNPERLISRQELLTEVWGYAPEVATRTVDTFIMRARRVVEPNPSKPQFLISIRGEGYCFRPRS